MSQPAHTKSSRPLRAPDAATRSLALQIAQRLDEKQAKDILVLDVSGPLVIADYFIIATVQSTRQGQAMAKELDIVPHLTMAATNDLEIGGVGSARELARILWPIDELAASYDRFVAQHKDVVPTLERLRERHDRISDRDFLPGALAMVIAFRFDTPRG